MDERPEPDGRALRGKRTRRAILARAMDIASLEGLEGLSIGRLATDLKVSKSGVFAHFGSKEELQLATIEAATAVFVRDVVQPGLAEPPGAERVRALCERWLEYSRARVFPGGCFFFHTFAEFDARPGRVRDALAAVSRNWLEYVEGVLEEARRSGGLAPDTDTAQLAFELVSFLESANSAAMLRDDQGAYDRAHRAVTDRLRASGAASG